LKSFFIALFLLGFLSPAIPTSPVNQHQHTTLEINRPDHLPILINLFSERLNESEEDKKDDENISIVFAEYPRFSYCSEFLNSGKPSDLQKTCHPYSYSELYTIYCEYLI
jgi:hypothetical protein